MKHDYMTDRNWALDEESTNSFAPKSLLKKALLSLAVFFIILAMAAYAWHQIKHHEKPVSSEAVVPSAITAVTATMPATPASNSSAQAIATPAATTDTPATSTAISSAPISS